MLTICKIALAPALLLQGARLRKTALRLPKAEGPREGSAGSGGAALRLLFVGDSSMAGVGVDWQHEAMPHQAAERVAAALDRPVSWQLIARSGVTVRGALDLVQAQCEVPADVVITALGVNDVTAQHGATRFVADYAALLDAVRARTGARCTVISGLPPMQKFSAMPQPLRWYLGQCAARLDTALRRWCASHDEWRFVALDWAGENELARDGFHPGRAQYRQWAERVTIEIVAVVRSGRSL